MRNILLSLIFVAVSYHGFTQSFEWITGQDIDYEFNPAMSNYTVACDGNGDVWFAGMDSLVEFYQQAMGNLFLKKYSSSGELLLDNIITGSAVVTDIATDDSGFVYITGDYLNDLTFWDGTTLPFTGQFIASFMARVSSQGQIDWVLDLDAIFPECVAKDIYIKGNRKFLAHCEGFNAYISEFNSNGIFTGSILQTQDMLISSICMDDAGNIYATGSCTSAGSTFGGVTFTSPFPYSMYLVKYNNNKVPVWVRFVEDVTCTLPSLNIDRDQNVIWTGILNAETNFDTLTLYGPSWVYDLFVTKFNPDGHVLWGVEVPQVITGDATVAMNESVEILPDNSIAVGGMVRGIVDWGNGVVSNAGGIYEQMLILDVNGSGQPDWSITGGGVGFVNAMAMTGDGEGNLYYAGMGHDTITFDTLSYTMDSFYFPFLLKYSSGITTGISAQNSPFNNVSFYPNPSQDEVHIKLDGIIEKVDFYNFSGQVVLVSQNTDAVDISHLQPGIYHVIVTFRNNGGAKDQVCTGKVIVSR